MKYRVGMSENNSGGGRWLSDEAHENLRERGWDVQSRLFGLASIAKDFEASSENVALAAARMEFYEATGFTGDEEGCNCCGQPFYFSANENGEPHYWESWE